MMSYQYVMVQIPSMMLHLGAQQNHGDGMSPNKEEWEIVKLLLFFYIKKKFQASSEPKRIWLFVHFFPDQKVKRSQQVNSTGKIKNPFMSFRLLFDCNFKDVNWYFQISNTTWTQHMFLFPLFKRHPLSLYNRKWCNRKCSLTSKKVSFSMTMNSDLGLFWQ